MSRRCWLFGLVFGICCYAEAPANSVGPCPSVVPEYAVGDLAPLMGRDVERTCILGASLRVVGAIRQLVKEREGAPLDGLVVREDIRALIDSGLVNDVRVIAVRSKGLSTVTLLYVIKENPRLADVVVEGNPGSIWGRIGQPYLLEASGRSLSPPGLNRTMRLVADAYANAGYPRAKVSAAIEPLEHGDVRVRVRIHEGTQSIVRAIRFEGVVQIPEAEIRKNLSTLIGKSYSPEVLQRDVELIAAKYQDRGLINATVQLLPTTEALGVDSVRVTFKIDEGDVFKVGDIKVVDSKPGSELALPSFQLRRGNVFSRSAAAQDKAELEARAISKGRKVECSPRVDIHLDSKTIDITYYLVEKM